MKFIGSQTDTTCPVMAWMDCAIEERCNGRDAPPPEPLHPETSWWHRLLSEPNVNMLEIIQLVRRQSTAGGENSLFAYQNKEKKWIVLAVGISGCPQQCESNKSKAFHHCK